MHGLEALITGDLERADRAATGLLQASAAGLSAWLRLNVTQAEDAPEAERLLAEARAVANAEPDRQGLLAMVEHLAALR